MEILHWLSVIFLAAFKVIPALGLAITYEMNPLEIFIALLVGNMVGIVFFTFFGVSIRKWRKARQMRKGRKKPIKVRRARRIKRLWNKVGILGIALITPPMISPPVGAMISVFFGEKQRRIFLYMFLSAVLWAAIFALLGKEILKLLYDDPTATHIL